MSRNRIKRLNVLTPQGFSGELAKEARYAFNYMTTERERGVSLIMPIRAESYASGALPAPFLQNRPEGFLLERLQHRFAKEGGLDEMDLLAYSSCQIGRLRFEQPATQKTRKPPQIGRAQLLKEQASKALFESLVDTYLLESGVSGVQPKVLIPDLDKTQLDSRITVVQPDLIVKAAGIDYPGLAQNEFLCMTAAKTAGLPVPDFWLSDNGQLFVMARFDLSQDGQSLGFEDFCSLFNKGGQVDAKYSSTYESLAKGVSYFCTDLAGRVDSLHRLFEYLALSVLVRNGDAHLKNFGLLYEHPGHPDGARLSPLYDVVTTSMYDMQPRVSGAAVYDRQLALKLNGSREYPSRAELIRFGREHCHVQHPEQVIERLSEAVAETLRKEAERIDAAILAAMTKEWGQGLLSLQPQGLSVPRHKTAGKANSLNSRGRR
ncbi:HipA domain-containing protein [Paludibacterium sp.]|uniref:type II toxin-antitoxin system HipA family toxin n=1 Tax=Paludibacterium sp. TaxID=1917523 RepID=UPI0025E944E9|nr:HipA domain-containing protein [Paludibacterium sp.]MBV8647248.1 HipA domain-containing protein [Paludibacterium sp.]